MNKILKPVAAVVVTLTLALGGVGFGGKISGATLMSGGSTGCCRQ